MCELIGNDILAIDSGLLNEEIPLSYVKKLKENKQEIEQTSRYLSDILSNGKFGNFFVDTYGEVADIWENIKYHSQVYGDKHNVSVRWDDKKMNLIILTSPPVLVYYRPNGLKGEVNALLVVSYKRAFIESENIAYQKRIAIYPFKTEQG